MAKACAQQGLRRRISRLAVIVAADLAADLAAASARGSGWGGSGARALEGFAVKLVSYTSSHVAAEEELEVEEEKELAEEHSEEKKNKTVYT